MQKKDQIVKIRHNAQKSSSNLLAYNSLTNCVDALYSHFVLTNRNSSMFVIIVKKAKKTYYTH
jgi:hypothetical protein